MADDEVSSTETRPEVEKVRCVIHYLTVIHDRHESGRDELLQERIHFHRRMLTEERHALITCVADESVPGSYANTLLTEVEFFGAPATIEDDPFTHKTLQIDFANKFIGGGVMDRGCVQEEIRFVVNTELLAALLFCEVMEDDESIIIVNTERYCRYRGYDSTFTFDGGFTSTINALDDVERRRIDCVVAVDALCYHQPLAQYDVDNISREVCKAVAGFSAPLHTMKDQVERNTMNDTRLFAVDSTLTLGDYSHISSGNWGCGAFKGDICLKLMIQMIAATLSSRRIRYFTFNAPAHALLQQCVQHCVQAKVTVGRLWTWTLQYAQLVRTKHKTDQAEDSIRLTTSTGAEHAIEENVALYVIRQCLEEGVRNFTD